MTLSRGDIHYVVTEYGIAYLHGKNIRERAMDLIAIAHPKFRQWLIEEAKKRNLIYSDQAFIPGVQGEYPDELEAYKTTRTGLRLLLRPVKLSDEPLLKDFFYSLSNDSMYQRFVSTRTDMHHDRLQPFVVIDYTEGDGDPCGGPGQQDEGDDRGHGAVHDRREHPHGRGRLRGARRPPGQGHRRRSCSPTSRTWRGRQGLLGFTAAVLMENRQMLQLFEKMGFIIEKRAEGGMYELKMSFRD